jgi:hypothetical protein
MVLERRVRVKGWDGDILKMNIVSFWVEKVF